LKFEILHTFSAARAGILKFGDIEVATPVFMPVATNATVKAVPHLFLKEMGYELILSNTFHLMLRPGEDVIKRFGGLHRFMGWEGAILTDSGGFQVFSISGRSITDEGVLFKSPIDGSKILLTPERVMRFQNVLGSNIAMVLDECTKPYISYEEAKEAVERTLKWSMACKKAHTKEDQALFGIVQGALYEELRKLSVFETLEIGFDGYAIGGLSVGERFDETLKILDVVLPLLPFEAPRYFMGLGTPELILEAVERGVDMFDCVYPTRVGRHGVAMKWKGKLNMRSAVYKEDKNPIDERCGCYTCRNFSRAYIHHLITRKEVTGMTLLTIHNLWFMKDFMQEMRESILKGTFSRFKEEVLSSWCKPTVEVM